MFWDKEPLPSSALSPYYNFPLTLETEDLCSFIRKLLFPIHFNDKNLYKLHPECPVWKNPDPAAGIKPQYHSNAQRKSLPEEAAATSFCIQNHTLLWSQLFLTSQFFQQKEHLDERGINHPYKDLENLLSHPPLLQGTAASR